MAGVTGRFFPTFGHHLGQAGNYRTFKETTLNNGGAGPFAGHLGQMVEDNGKVWRLVQYVEATIAGIDGGVMYWLAKANWTVTSDASDGEALADGVAGGLHQALTAATDTGSYIYIQCGGDQAAVVVAASTVAGDHMTGHASTDNVLTRTAAGTAAPDLQCATALSTRGTTTSDAGASVANSSKVRWILGHLL